MLNNLVGQVEFAREAANVGDDPELNSFRLALKCFPRLNEQNSLKLYFKRFIENRSNCFEKTNGTARDRGVLHSPCCFHDDSSEAWLQLDAPFLEAKISF